MPGKNFLSMPQKPLLSKSWQTNKASFITFPIPSTFCAYNLRAGYAEQHLTMNCHTATIYFSSGPRHEITGISFQSVCSMYFYYSCSGKVTAFPPISLLYAFHIKSVSIQTNQL